MAFRKTSKKVRKTVKRKRVSRGTPMIRGKGDYTTTSKESYDQSNNPNYLNNGPGRQMGHGLGALAGAIAGMAGGPATIAAGTLIGHQIGGHIGSSIGNIFGYGDIDIREWRLFLWNDDTSNECFSEQP